MAVPYSVKPDREFIRRVINEGGGDLKKCYQCATCSVVCELSKGARRFPRKEMIWAQWGLKDRLMADPDVWLCHQCNDCSTRCPRGARPGDVLAALRAQHVAHYSIPGFLGGWVNKVSGLPMALGLGAVLIILALLVRGPVESAIPALAGAHGFWAEFFPHWLLIAFFSTITILTFLCGVVGVLRFWSAMKAADESEGTGSPVLGVIPAFINTLKAIFVHNKFGSCIAEAPRRLAHLTAFYGFVALFIVTVWAVIDLYVNPFLGIDSLYPFGLMHPMKILANIGCVALIYGCVTAIRNRMGHREEAGAGSPFDWIFVLVLLFVGITGLLTEILRFTIGSGAAAHATEGAGLGFGVYLARGVYFIHLVLVFQLLVYLPYSKFAHILYRTAAMVYSEHTGRQRVEGQAG